MDPLAILAAVKELAEAGLKVVALERGAMRSTDKDYAVPNIRDELRYVVRHDLMQNTARDTLTVRNNPTQEALPMRRLGSRNSRAVAIAGELTGCGEPVSRRCPRQGLNRAGPISYKLVCLRASMS